MSRAVEGAEPYGFRIFALLSYILPNLTLFFGEEALFVRFSRHFSHILCHLIGDFLEGSYTYKGVEIC